MYIFPIEGLCFCKIREMRNLTISRVHNLRLLFTVVVIKMVTFILKWYCFHSDPSLCIVTVSIQVLLYTERREPYLQKTYLRICAPSEDSDQLAHSRKLIRIFTGRIKDTHECSVLTVQTAPMRRLICVFVGRTCLQSVFLHCGQICLN